MSDRLAHLQAEVRQANLSLTWGDGIRGLTLRLDKLRELGARPDILDKWRNGQALGAQPAAPRH
eukprot:1908731-Pyramimonas_sp.AAC.1